MTQKTYNLGMESANQCDQSEVFHAAFESESLRRCDYSRVRAGSSQQWSNSGGQELLLLSLDDFWGASSSRQIPRGQREVDGHSAIVQHLLDLVVTQCAAEVVLIQLIQMVDQMTFVSLHLFEIWGNSPKLSNLTQIPSP